jgi:hypothetical protein
MPIKKYSTFNDASKGLWVLNPDDKYYVALKNNFAFWSKLSSKKTKQGITKFKDYQEFLNSKSKF